MTAKWLSSRRTKDSDDHWISVSDLMSGLMILFLFIAIAYMIQVIKQAQTVREIAVTWNTTQEELYQALESEFRADLPRWKAEIDRSALSIRFDEPSILFASGQSNVPDRFREILADFFPRYLRVIRNYSTAIEEVRIEGHTSSEWSVGTGSQKAASPEEAYFSNMQLSQNRTRAVLQFCLTQTPVLDEDRAWARGMITANGLSSSKLILTRDGVEDRERSRRVEFRVRTNAERRILTILEVQQ